MLGAVTNSCSSPQLGPSQEPFFHKDKITKNPPPSLQMFSPRLARLCRKAAESENLNSGEISEAVGRADVKSIMDVLTKCPTLEIFLSRARAQVGLCSALTELYRHIDQECDLAIQANANANRVAKKFSSTPAAPQAPTQALTTTTLPITAQHIRHRRGRNEGATAHQDAEQHENNLPKASIKIETT